jgi:long-chain acyl-CoA synthetase
MDESEVGTLRALLERSVAKFAGRPALSTVGGRPTTYAELGSRVAALSAELRGCGVGPGDPVAILGRNMPQWPVAYLAVVTMGAVAVPILPDFSEDEIGNILRHSGSRAAFVSAPQLARLSSVAGAVPVLFRLDDLSRLKGAAARAPSDAPAVTGESLAAIIYTSGTTGRSKGVMLTHANLVSNVRATAIAVPIREDDRLLSVLPLAHTYECTLGLLIPLMCGACVSYLDRPPSSSALLPALREVRPTMMLTVPLIIDGIYRKQVLPRLTAHPLLGAVYRIPIVRRLLHRAAGRRLRDTFGGRLRFFGVGGAALATDVERFLREARFPYAVGYGLTETSPLIAGCGPAVTRFRSTGPAIPGVEIRIDAADPATGEGEIVVRGPNVMAGYYKDPQRTAEVLDRSGWLRTGDRGVLDGSGYLFIRGRSKTMILGASGENIYPEEIEAVINEHDFVEESLVFEREGKLVARVRLNYERLQARLRVGAEQVAREAEALLQDLRRGVNGRLAAFSRLGEVVEQVEPFEKTPTLKIKRFLYDPGAPPR